jgi:hypothetical protein
MDSRERVQAEPQADSDVHMSVTHKVGIAGRDPTPFAFLTCLETDCVNLATCITIKESLKDKIFNLGRQGALQLLESRFTTVVYMDEEGVQR